MFIKTLNIFFFFFYVYSLVSACLSSPLHSTPLNPLSICLRLHPLEQFNFILYAVTLSLFAKNNNNNIENRHGSISIISLQYLLKK